MYCLLLVMLVYFSHMSRPLRIEYPGAFYHVMSRGNAKQTLFLSDSDRISFLHLLAGITRDYCWICHAYCLMNNHYHLIVETPAPNLSKGMRDLNGIYSQEFNRQYHRVGHVMQGRFKSPVIQDDAYFLELSRYVVLNPVRSNLVENPGEWKWSSYLATSGLEAVPDYLHVDLILELLNENIHEARKYYRRFIQQGKGKQASHAQIGEVVVGQAVISEEVKSILASSRHEKSFRRIERYADRIPLERLFYGNKDRSMRNERILRAYYENGYTMSEIADFLEVQCSTVSRVIKRSRERELCSNAKSET